MFRIKSLALAAALSGTLTGAAFAQDDVSADTVVATVNGTDITVGHMIALRSQLPQQYQSMPAEVLFDGVLEQLVRQTILQSAADELSPAGQTVLENERRAIFAAEAATRIVEDAVTEEALRAAYDENYGSAEPATEYNASHILVETEDEAQALIEELDGGADFAELARENSTGPSGPNGGSLGWFGPGMMVAPFEEAVVGMEPGDVAGPVETQFGWHVIKLNETREQGAPAFEEVRGELTQQLQEQAIQAGIADLTAEAEVERPDISGIDPAVINDTALLRP